MRAALFITCFNDTLFPETGIATTKLLERLGVQASFPLEQTCCGQMHYNTGYQREALLLIRHFVEAFQDVEVIVCPSASCAGMVRNEYPHAAAQSGDAALVEAVAGLVPRVYELSEFLVKQLQVTDVGAYFPHRVTYHPTCHSLRGLHVGEMPLTLLKAVRGIDLVDLPDATECCGFGGTFAVKDADTSRAILSDKIHAVLTTRAEVCCAVDTSCLMHIGGALSRQRAGCACCTLPRSWLQRRRNSSDGNQRQTFTNISGWREAGIGKRAAAEQSAQGHQHHPCEARQGR